MPTVFTTVGKEWVIDVIDAAAGARYLAWGTGTHTAAAGDTALTTEASEGRVICVESQPTATTIRWVGILTGDSTKFIKEAGIFSASSGGVLIVSDSFTQLAVIAGDMYEFTYSAQQT